MPAVNSSMCNISSTVVAALHCNIGLHNEKQSDRLRIQPRVCQQVVLLTNNSLAARRKITTYNLSRSGAEEANAPPAEVLTKPRQWASSIFHTTIENIKEDILSEDKKKWPRN